MKILGIETSCDETAASVVEDGKTLLSNVVTTQIDIHKKYGGVVPEIAARSHIEVINPVIEKALDDANLSWDEIDAIAVTNGPGLSGSLLIGTLAARTLALTKNKPLYPVNHVTGHVYANFLNDPQPAFPMLALIVSGGHTQLALFHDHLDYVVLGQTQDDAVGEAYDKVAKVLGLEYPGGPSIEKASVYGNPDAYDLPKARMPMREIYVPSSWARSLDEDGLRDETENRTEPYPVYGEGDSEVSTKQSASKIPVKSGLADSSGYLVQSSYDFSFSGLKTAVLRRIQKEVSKPHDFPSFKLSELLDESQVNDFAASFNKIAAETLVDKTKLAFDEFSPASVVVAGGVAANKELRRQLQEAIPLEVSYLEMSLCTDNAAMIATLAYYQSQKSEAVNPHLVGVHPNLKM